MTHKIFIFSSVFERPEKKNKWLLILIDFIIYRLYILVSRYQIIIIIALFHSPITSDSGDNLRKTDII